MHKTRFCIKGHDTWIVGRTKSRNCRQCQVEYNREYQQLHKEDLDEYHRKRRKSDRKRQRKNNGDKIRSYFRNYYSKNREKIREQSRNSRLKNKSKMNRMARLNQKLRRQKDPLFKLTGNLRSRLNKALKSKRWTKNNHFKEYIGCTLPELKAHLESQFQPGMTWNNNTTKGWHVDHIIPLASAKNIEELYKLCHYTNLQPLWATDNIRKGDKLPH